LQRIEGPIDWEVDHALVDRSGSLCIEELSRKIGEMVSQRE
jgi:hypothetical protein